MEPTDDKITELISQYSAELLPEDVKDIIPDFFMESIHISEQIETVGRLDYVGEAFGEEGLRPTIFQILFKSFCSFSVLSISF